MSFVPQTPEWQTPLTVNQPTATPPRPQPTSAPKPANNPERKPKLRASCDACAASKVKCSKEHPICARCNANGSQCIYGVSRKHGKPGRTRKRNPDGTPFVKASKQRPSPDGSEFSKFRLRPEPILPDPEMDSASNWSPTPSWPATPDFDFEMTPEPLFTEPSDYFSFMDDILMPMPTFQPEPEAMQTIQPELTFIDPFARKQSVRLDLPDIQALKDFIGGDAVNPMDYTFADTTPMDTGFLPDSGSSTPQSPKSTPSYFHNPLRVSISMPSSHCCYTLAYSTLESLRIINPENSAGVELKSLDAVLSITKTAVANVLQLLSCSCSSDPHLAMLYSSITSKILAWYQIAAGVKPTSPPTSPPSLSGASSPSSSTFSSPLSTPSSENTTFNIEIKPVKIGLFEFDEAEQEALRRQVVLRELRKCGTLVDALANWGSESKTEQAEFLYDVLGAWLKSELYKTLREVEGEEAL
ncbi:hypothetical protein BU26DRAFT_55124 [Trematosphaeria pertusa]|uniref:Zn(2)-C6 fungal-type domain-containing protein n=1 Tax=Trematosphaeria pertusa TaxID=390896 RepID=A0A6A6IA10_9PLEO|nr:uncharacterized protein BU26DRAFT_55124 [Trematosphaeria pertusa]KAF2246888.1 hypothetical protein BU26DRAFT_55124 [Trematosphaeria pertusa]